MFRVWNVTQSVVHMIKQKEAEFGFVIFYRLEMPASLVQNSL